MVPCSHVAIVSHERIVTSVRSPSTANPTALTEPCLYVCGQHSLKLGQSDHFPVGGSSSAMFSCLHHLACVFDRDPPAPH